MARDERFERMVNLVFQRVIVRDKRGNVIAENDSDDPGGLTKYGIDQASHPDVDIHNLTEEEAKEIARFRPPRPGWRNANGLTDGRFPFPNYRQQTAAAWHLAEIA